MDWRLILDVAALVGLLIGGFLYLRSVSARLNADETAKLAQTRGDRIEDLEQEVERLSLRIVRLEGQMEAIQSIKAQEIALEVVRLVHRDFSVQERSQRQEGS